MSPPTPLVWGSIWTLNTWPFRESTSLMGKAFISPAEMAQIAGRAGRYKRDGTFGTLSGVEPLPPRVIESIEQHGSNR